MPSKSEKQKKFFGAVMGAKKGQSGVSGKAKKVAKEMPKKEIKKFLKTDEDEESMTKKMKRDGKVSFDAPTVKERKVFAPATKTEKPKKGRGSYDRKKTFDEDEEQKDCWKGYKKKGTKKKGGKTVNNCVKENTEIQAFVEAIINEEPSKAFDHLRKAVEIKLQNRIKAELDKPIF